jgi:hypothetical protein
MNSANNDTIQASWRDYDGPVPLKLAQEERERPLRSALTSSLERLETAEDTETELLSRIEEAESMCRHVPAFLERKLERVRERIERLQTQVLSLEHQLDEDA